MFLLCVVLFEACARVGYPTGGEKDTTPPRLIKAVPPSGSTNFQGNRIRLYFDELVVLKDLRKQLIVSPPMNYFPEITPTSNASRIIDVKITDTLKPNTTYIFNFGKSIQDNNEGNTLPFFSYVFSTGNNIDSLSLEGKVTMAYSPKIKNHVSVMLYEVNEKYTDSLIYKEKPTYITTTTDSLHEFSLTHLRKGTYKLVALQEKMPNYVFNSKDDLIGFYQTFITLPTDSTYHLRLFKEIPQRLTKRPFINAAHRISFGYEGKADSIKIISPQDFLAISKDNEKDTLHLWLPKMKYDSLNVIVRNIKTDTFKLKFRKHKVDTLTLSLKNELISPKEARVLVQSNIPLKNFNIQQVGVNTVEEKELNAVTNIQANELKDGTLWELRVPTEQNKKYQVQVLPGAFTDIYNTPNDTLKTVFTAPASDKFASLRLKPSKAFRYPIIVELLTEHERVAYSQVVRQKVESFFFEYVKPAKYLVRIIEDTNNNGEWDTGDFLQGKQPEEVFFLPRSIELRANWEVEEVF